MDEERELYAGTLEADRFEAWLGKNVKKAGEWYKDASADQAGLGDDILRILGGGARNLAWASELPVAKQTLQVLDIPSWILGKVGGVAAKAVGVDPRIGGAIGNIGGSFMTLGGVAKVGKVGAIKGAHKLVKTNLPGQQIARNVLDMHIQGQARKVLGARKSLSRTHSQIAPQFGDEARAVMSNLEPAQWQKQYAQLPDQLSRERFLKRGFGGQIKAMYVEGGKVSPRSLAKDPATMQKLMDRADRITDRFRAGDQRKLYDEASWNIFEEAKQVYGDNALVKKVQAAFLGVQGKQWHHIFGNKEAGEFLLNSVSQDPVVAANLFKHMENLNLKSGAIAENMALMRNAPHNSWHRFMEDMGIEPRVKMKIGETLEKLKDRNLLAQQDKAGRYVKPELRISKSTGKNQPFKYTAPLDVADFGHAIAEGIQKGTTDINELFTFLTVYHKKYVPWMKQQLKDPKYAAEFLSDLPDGPEKALLLGLYQTKKGPGLASTGTRGMKNRTSQSLAIKKTKLQWDETAQTAFKQMKAGNLPEARWRKSNIEFTWAPKDLGGKGRGYIDVIKDVAGDDDYFALQKQFFEKIKTLPSGTEWTLEADTAQKYRLYKRMFRGDPRITPGGDTKLLKERGIDHFVLRIP